MMSVENSRSSIDTEKLTVQLIIYHDAVRNTRLVIMSCGLNTHSHKPHYNNNLYVQIYPLHCTRPLVISTSPFAISKLVVVLCQHNGIIQTPVHSCMHLTSSKYPYDCKNRNFSKVMLPQWHILTNPEIGLLPFYWLHCRFYKPCDKGPKFWFLNDIFCDILEKFRFKSLKYNYSNLLIKLELINKTQ